MSYAMPPAFVPPASDSLPVIRMTEHFDQRALRYCLENWETLPLREETRAADDKWVPKEICEKYLAFADEGLIEVSYKQTWHGTGRFFARGGLSLQGMPREIRHTIARDLYHDIDMVNAHPVLLLQWCERKGLETPALRRYISDREAFLAQIPLPREEAKRLVLAMTNGGAQKAAEAQGMPGWLRDYAEEMRFLHTSVGVYEPTFFSIVKSRTDRDREWNLGGRIMNCLLCNIENTVLQAVLQFAREEGKCRGDASLVFDGLMLRKAHFSSERDLQAFLRGAEKAVLDRTGFRISLVVKPMEEGFEIPANFEPLAAPKDEPEERPCLFAYNNFGKSEHAHAHVFQSLFGGRIVNDGQERGATWFEFRAPRWHRISTLRIRDLIKHDVSCAWIAESKRLLGDAEQAPTEDKKKALIEQSRAMSTMAQQLCSAAAKERVIQELHYMLRDEGLADRMDSDGSLLGFEDVLWDHKIGAFREGRPEDWVSFSVGYPAPKEPSACQLADWERFFASVYRDVALRRYVIGRLGACLDGRTCLDDHNVFLLTGSGGNGKSIMMRLVQRALGQYYKSVSIAAFTQKRTAHTGADPVFAGLRGVRFVATEEPDGSEKLNGALVKEISGGGEITARALYSAPISFRGQFYLWFAANGCLELDGADAALGRRLKVIPHLSLFREDIRKADPEAGLYPADNDFIRRLEGSADVFMWMLLHAAVQKVPEVVKKASDAYMGARDVVMSFVGERMVRGDPAADAETLSAIRGAFEMWKRDTGCVEKIRPEVLKERLIKLLGTCHEQKKMGGRRLLNCFVGWKLRLHDSDSDDE